jgi:hypothetical protein
LRYQIYHYINEDEKWKEFSRADFLLAMRMLKEYIEIIEKFIERNDCVQEVRGYLNGFKFSVSRY